MNETVLKWVRYDGTEATLPPLGAYCMVIFQGKTHWYGADDDYRICCYEQIEDGPVWWTDMCSELLVVGDVWAELPVAEKLYKSMNDVHMENAARPVHMSEWKAT